MNKRIFYAVIAVIVVIILVVAVLEIVVVPTSKASITVSVSSYSATTGTTLTFSAFVSPTPSKVVFNFGDGTTATATHLSADQYTVSHSYSYAGSYLVTANATVNGKTVNSLSGIFEVSVTPATVSPTLASMLTAPIIIMSSQIISPGSAISLTASTLQPPTATNWTVGYYIWNFGDGTTHTDYTVFNTSSSSFMASNTTHLYSNAGIYPVTLGVITFNATNYIPTTYTSNGINYTYYPLSDLASILSSNGNYYNNTYISTIVVNSTAKLLTTTVPVTNPNEIIDTELQPGGPSTFDPAINYGTCGMEVIMNVYERLLQYNGTSNQLFPLVASEIPTVANGGISSNGLTYTFNIRPGLKFANGDPLTAWNTYTSYVRDLLFVDSTPIPAGWMLAQDLLPGGGFAPNATSYQNITSAITVDNTTQTVTFHLLKPDLAFLDYIADLDIGSVVDYSWLVAHGAGITFTPAGFSAYLSQGSSTGYNTYVQFNAMGSGPYMIKNYISGQSILLSPNPYFTPVPGIPGYNHTANDTVYIQWEKDADTALLIAESGQTDLVYTTGLPTSDFPILMKLQSEGKLKITTFPSVLINFYNFNFDVNTSMLSTLGSGYHIPQYYFANLDVRRAFAYAFNYTNFIENILGNARYGLDFGFQYAQGLAPLGMPGYLNTTQLQQRGAVVPTYNLSIAKQYLEESGLYNTSINIPIIVFAADSVNYAGAGMWASALHSIDPNIQATPLYMEIPVYIGYSVPNENPMPISFTNVGPDYLFTSDYAAPMYGVNGYFGEPEGWTPQMLNSSGQPTQANEDAQMNQIITDAMSTTNLTLALKYYDQAMLIAVNLTFDVYTCQSTELYVYSTAIHGSSYEGNALDVGFTYFIYLSKS